MQTTPGFAVICFYFTSGENGLLGCDLRCTSSRQILHLPVNRKIEVPRLSRGRHLVSLSPREPNTNSVLTKTVSVLFVWLRARKNLSRSMLL